jgi:hypothetical protein
MGVREYWRFDETGQFHGTRLAGDRLVDDHYEPINLEQVAEGILQGYSAALELIIRWEHGQLRWHDPATGRHIPTFEAERARAEAAEAQVRELEAKLAKRDRQD